MTTTGPETAGDGYFLYHSIGQYPGKAPAMAAGLAEFAARWGAADDGQWGHALGLRARFIDRWRALIGAPEGTLTTCENVTAGLHSLIGALPADALRGKRLLIAGDCFPSLHFLLAGLAPRLGFTLDTVRARPGAAWVEDADVLARWGTDVGLALITWISSTSSHRTDIAALVAHGRRMGSIIGVDITQGAGLIPFDVTDPAVDFALSTSLKWMCGTPGAGILQVAPALLRECRPELRGWFSQADIFSGTSTPSPMPPTSAVSTMAPRRSWPAPEPCRRSTGTRARITRRSSRRTAALRHGSSGRQRRLVTLWPAPRRKRLAAAASC